MRSFELLQKVVREIDDPELHDASLKLLEAIDRELTSEDYDEGEAVSDACDEVETALKVYLEKESEEDDEEEPAEEDDDDEDDDDDDLADFSDEEEEEAEEEKEATS